MSHSTFFEIGGEVVEVYLQRPGLPPRPSLTSMDPHLQNVEEQTGLDLAKLSKKYQRAKRARWALTSAGTMAAVDGPVPIGDAIAMGFLAAYGAYELIQIFTE